MDGGIAPPPPIVCTIVKNNKEKSVDSELHWIMSISFT